MFVANSYFSSIVVKPLAIYQKISGYFIKRYINIHLYEKKNQNLDQFYFSKNVKSPSYINKIQHL